jgi:RNA polymerase sigma-70 factor (ECF subfamily)
LTALLAVDAISYADGGGKAAAAIHPIVGQAAVIQLVLGLARRAPANTTVSIAVINGREALVFREQGEVATVMMFETMSSSIQTIYFMRNPDKLTGLRLA